MISISIIEVLVIENICGAHNYVLNVYSSRNENSLLCK